MVHVIIQNTTRALPQIIQANYCDTFISKFRGLMMQPAIKPCSGILMAESKDSRVDTAIHMLFMRFDIAVIWINSNQEVVDTRLARKWQLMLVPAAPARYVLETHPDHLGWFRNGDRLELIHA